MKDALERAKANSSSSYIPLSLLRTGLILPVTVAAFGSYDT